MHPVTFVRTSPEALGEAPGGDASVCITCGSVLRDEHGDAVGGGYTNPLSLDDYLVQHPHATYFVEVGSEEARAITENTYLGVRTGDMLTVDRILTPRVGNLILAICSGELVLCRFTEHNGRRFLVCGQESREPVEISQETGVSIWGVVSALSRKL